MKKIFIIICLLFFSVNITAQNNLKSKDSIANFYDELVSIMKAEYFFKEQVDWTQIETELNERLYDSKGFKNSLDEVTFLFDKLNASHCSVHFEENIYKDSNKGPTSSDFSEKWLKKYATNPNFEVKVIDNQYGYILMPGINILNDKESHKIAQPMYNQINELKNSKTIKGWIIDLRFNTGGAVTPMLLALYDFLGDNDVWGVLDIDKKRTDIIELSEGNYKYNSKKSSYINPKGELLDKVKVAVITNIATASSGEITALSFKGRENTIFIGEKTYGATTSNVIRNLPFGAYMALTVGYDCDRNGKFYKKIIPDIKIAGKDDFDNLLLDGKIQEGIKYFNEK
tara:strand:- start:394 stop:1419 length:1026 start_codon:yes stop_codon:yes gene_type:complete